MGRCVLVNVIMGEKCGANFEKLKPTFINEGLRKLVQLCDNNTFLHI